jgi:transcriptional regulator with XRE-family HTH domain
MIRQTPTTVQLFEMKNISLKGSGTALRELREEQGLGLREVAVKAGLQPGVLSKYENNIIGIPLDITPKIAKALGRSAEVVTIRLLREAYKPFKNEGAEVGRLFGEMLETLESSEKAKG